MIGSLERGPNTLFNKTGSIMHPGSKGERYSNVRASGQKSEGEVGAVGDEDDISLGEIKVPGVPHTETYINAKKGKLPTNKSPFPMSMGVSPQVRQPTGNLRGPLGETINYEEDKVSPEKEDERPLYDSSEGPIQTMKGRGSRPITQKSGVIGSKNMVASFDSFGIKRSGGAATKQHAYLRETIQDDFLNENEEDDINASIESGEIQSMFAKK